LYAPCPSQGDSGRKRRRGRKKKGKKEKGKRDTGISSIPNIARPLESVLGKKKGKNPKKKKKRRREK